MIPFVFIMWLLSMEVAWYDSHIYHACFPLLYGVLVFFSLFSSQINQKLLSYSFPGCRLQERWPRLGPVEWNGELVVGDVSDVVGSRCTNSWKACIFHRRLGRSNWQLTAWIPGLSRWWNEVSKTMIKREQSRGDWLVLKGRGHLLFKVPVPMLAMTWWSEHLRLDI